MTNEELLKKRKEAIGSTTTPKVPVYNKVVKPLHKPLDTK
jgi:hypothetical protein